MWTQIRSFFDRWREHRENYIPPEENLFVEVEDGLVVIRRKNGTEWKFLVVDVVEITAYETPDFLGCSVTFEFLTASGERFNIHESFVGMREFARAMKDEYGILLDFEIPVEPRVIYSRAEN